VLSSDNAVTGFSVCRFSINRLHSYWNLSSCDLELWPMPLTIEVDLESTKMNRLAKYLGQKSFRSTVIVRTHKHTQRIDYSTRTTKTVDKSQPVIDRHSCTAKMWQGLTKVGMWANIQRWIAERLRNSLVVVFRNVRRSESVATRHMTEQFACQAQNSRLALPIDQPLRQAYCTTNTAS